MDWRPASLEDIPFIVTVEHAPSNREFIGRFTEAEHAAAIIHPDYRYFLALADSGEPVGYTILRGFQFEHRNIELKRIAVASPGQGHGRILLRLLLEKIFEDFGAHRVWLDVFVSNLRAQHLYRSLGFQQDGIFRESVLRDGVFHSQLLMSMLDREYDALFRKQDF